MNAVTKFADPTQNRVSTFRPIQYRGSQARASSMNIWRPSCPRAGRTSSSRFTPKTIWAPAADRIMRSKESVEIFQFRCMACACRWGVRNRSTSRTSNAFVGSSNVISRRWSPNIWRGRRTRVRISMTYCRCRIPRPLSSVSALTCSRCRTPSVARFCWRTLRAISCFASPP